MSYSSDMEKNDKKIQQALQAQIKSQDTKPAKQKKISVVPNPVPNKELKKNYILTLKPSTRAKLNEQAKQYGYIRSNGKPNASQFLEALIEQL